jgi:hypothetical protein
MNTKSALSSFTDFYVDLPYVPSFQKGNWHFSFSRDQKGIPRKGHPMASKGCLGLRVIALGDIKLPAPTHPRQIPGGRKWAAAPKLTGGV